MSTLFALYTEISLKHGICINQLIDCGFPGKLMFHCLHVSGEVKTLLRQLLSGVNHLHDNWIIHRDLKTSNLLLSHKGILKVHL